MKKKMLLPIVIILVIAVVGGVIYIIFFKNVETAGTFKLADYSEYMADYNDYFPTEEMPAPFGPINSSKEAKEAAEAIWKEIYGDSITKRKPYRVFFDEENRVWLVQGSFPVFWTGGGPHILLQKVDGKVLAIWHEKF